MANQEQLELLKQGVESWNRWRIDNPTVEIDFNSTNLDGLTLIGANLRFVGFYCASLVGVNLAGANLTGAYLGNADLSRANLSGAVFGGARLGGANFSSANLSNVDFYTTEALGTCFYGAILTGACIQDWNINSVTQLTDVVCEYVYLTQNQEARRPHSGKFKPGEFAALFQKALETVDLIFADGIDWQAFFQSFQELRSQYDDLSIQAIEKKSGGAFVVRLEVPPEADKGTIEREIKESYDEKLKILESSYQAQLQIQGEQLEHERKRNGQLMRVVEVMAENTGPKYDLRYSQIGNLADTVKDNASQTASNFTQAINSNIDDITKLINALRGTAQTFPEQQREEALVHLDDLQEDLSQPEKQKPQRIKTRLVALFAIASTASGYVVGATDFSNKVLDLSKKLGIELVHPPSNPQLPPSK